MKNYMGEVIEIVPPKEITEESLANYIAELAGVVYDKDVKNPIKRFKALQTEAYGDSASRVTEYIPCRLNADKHISSIQTSLQLFGFFDDHLKQYYCTNARELLNWGWTLDEVIKAVDFTHYKAFRCVAPYFVYGQINTHTQLTTVSHSQRYAKSSRGYWIPKEVTRPDEARNVWDNFIVSSSPNEIKSFMRDAVKITRKEVWDRGADMLQYRPFSIGGYIQNNNAWKHFLKQRLDKHTQKETSDFVQMFQDYMQLDLLQ